MLPYRGSHRGYSNRASGDRAPRRGGRSSGHKKYRREMAAASESAMLDTLAALSHQADFSVGCYCADESRCHRSVLRELLIERGAQVK
jgi:hypothetical protein